MIHGLQCPCRLGDICHERIPKGPPGSHISMAAICVCFLKSSTCGRAILLRQADKTQVSWGQLSSSRFHEKPGFGLALLSGGLDPSG